MTRASTAYAALVAAIGDEPPPCRGDTRFTEDVLPLGMFGAVQLVCSSCPVFGLCRAYALLERPAAGIWAGERWNERKRPGRPTKGVTA